MPAVPHIADFLVSHCETFAFNYKLFNIDIFNMCCTVNRKQAIVLLTTVVIEYSSYHLLTVSILFKQWISKHNVNFA